MNKCIGSGLQDIAILNYYHFPEGMSATTRIISYAKGLVQNGVVVESVIFRPKLDSDPTPMDGEVEGMRFHYCSTRPEKRSQIAKILLDRPAAMIRACRYIISSHFDFVLLSFDQLKYLLFFVPILTLAGVRLAFIGDEYPYAIREKQKSRVPAWQLFLYKVVSVGLKARILINQTLQAFYDEKITRKPTYILSTVIDTDRFPSSLVYHAQPRNYFCYMGGMQLNNDNVDNIIRAISFLEDCTMPLYLFGTPSPEDLKVIEGLILEYGLQDKVFFKGRASYAEVPAVLTHASVLLTSQADTMRARGGVPTKIGEYMLSGTPFLTTDVGDVSSFLKDGETGFLVEPCNPQRYAEKISFILSHYEEALQVARNGREYVFQHYSAVKQAKGMIDFLQNLM